MSLNVTLIAGAAQYIRYDGTNSAEIISHFAKEFGSEGPDDHRVFDISIESEGGGVLVVNWEAGWRNHANTLWEVWNYGPSTVNDGDFIALNEYAAFNVLPASHVGVTSFIIANPTGA